MVSIVILYYNIIILYCIILYIILYYIILYYIILYYIILYYIIFWDHRRICGPSLTETSLCSAYPYCQKDERAKPGRLYTKVCAFGCREALDRKALSCSSGLQGIKLWLFSCIFYPFSKLIRVCSSYNEFPIRKDSACLRGTDERQNPVHLCAA